MDPEKPASTEAEPLRVAQPLAAPYPEMDAGPTEGGAMEPRPTAPMRVVRRPAWVRLALYRVPSRKAAFASMGLSVVLAAACVVAAQVLDDVRWLYGSGLSVAGVWYALAIRWMDRHKAW